ncbi:MAG TPA: hypothetical protein VIT65_24570 [Microlunatus sp.]
MPQTIDPLDPCLLTYGFSTAPAPLAISTAGATGQGRINLAVFNAGKTVYCSELIIAVPLGAGATDLCETSPDASVSTGRWAITSVAVVDGGTVGLGAGPVAAITFDARTSADQRIDYPLVLGLTVEVNSAPGTVACVVRERSGTDPDHLAFKSATFPLDKHPPVLSVGNFLATAPEAPTVPRAAFGNGQPIRLSWESNGTWFQLYRGDDTRPIYAGPASSHLVSAGLTRDSTFVLEASVSSGPAGDGSGGFRPIYQYVTLSLDVTNPDLTPRSVTASGAVTAGSLSTDSLGAVAATLGATWVLTSLNVGPQAPGPGMDADVPVGLLGKPASLNTDRQYRAPTDGLVIGTIRETSGLREPDVGEIFIATGGYSVTATGGNRLVTLSGDRTVDDTQSILLPVRCGGVFATGGKDYKGRCERTFSWVPFGVGSPSLDVADTELTRLRAEDERLTEEL